MSAFEALPLAVTAKTIPAVFLHAEDRASAQLNKGNMGDASESSFGGSMLRMQNAVAIAEPEGASQHEEGEGNAGSVGTGTRPDVLLQLQSSRLHLNHTDPPGTCIYTFLLFVSSL